MRRIEIFDPAVGCATGACGPDEQDEAGAQESLLEALRTRGVDVQRFNLGHEPEEFARNAVVKAALRESGLACLPLVLVDGELVCQGRYLSASELQRFAAA